MKNRARLVPPDVVAVLLVVACFALGGCQADGSAPGSLVVTDSAGVSLVQAPGTDRPLAWSAERVVTIHPLEDEGEGFFSVADVTVLGGARIAVLDRDGSRVVTFDENGAFLAQAGRKGSGPEEFEFPMGLSPEADGGVSVFDAMNQRLTSFDSTLALVGTDPLLGITYFGGGIAPVGDSRVFAAGDMTSPGTQLLLSVGATDTTEFVRHDREVTGVVTLESCGLQLGGVEPLFSPRTLWTAGPGDAVFVAGTDHYEIDVHRAPTFSLVRRIRRAIPVIEATEDLAMAAVGEGMRLMTPTGVRICDQTEVVQARGFAPLVPPISALAVSPGGEIFAARWAPDGEDPAIDVLTLEGEYLGTLPAGFPFPDAFLGNDRIVVAEEDDMGLGSVVVYRLVR